MSKLIVNLQLAWMQADYEEHDGGSKHTFIFTHGPIVGHGSGATHDTYAIIGGSPVKIVDRDTPFVAWVNEAGMTVEAVFCGHTHEAHAYYSISTSNMNDVNLEDYNCYYDRLNTPLSPYESLSIFFTDSTLYFETDTSCKEYP